MNTHEWTTDAARFPLHAVEPGPEDQDQPWYVRFSFERFEREWNDTAEQHAAKNEFFDRTMGAKRDADKAREWGISIDELPWNARTPS